MPRKAERRCAEERHPNICNQCRHYRRCVTSRSYCPPYSIALRFWYGRGHEPTDVISEMLERKKESWTLRDLCAICNHRCALTEEEDRMRLEKPLEMWAVWRKHCRALEGVAGIPCPTGVEEGSHA